MNDFVAIPSSYQFDDLEERMIEALKPDPLMATSTLAELLGVTRSQVITRLRRIEKNEAAHVLTQINACAGGYRIAQAFLKVERDNLQEAVAGLAAHPETLLVSSVLGDEDLFVMFRMHQSRPFADLYERICGCKGIVGIRLHVLFQVIAFSGRWISFSRVPVSLSLAMRKARLARDLSELELDDLDLSILAELLEDGRRTVRAIARAYDVSDGTIRYRLRNLRSQGLLNTTMAVDPTTAGLHTWAFLEIAVRPSGMGDLVSQLQCKEWLEGLSLKTGDRALFCTMLTGSARELNSVVAWIRTHPAVRDVSPYLTTDIHVMDRRWCLPIGSV